MLSFFFFNYPATTEIYTLSLHDALPISRSGSSEKRTVPVRLQTLRRTTLNSEAPAPPSSRLSASRRSEEHTSELQSLTNLVCRLLLEKKKKYNRIKKSISSCDKKK